MPRKPNKEFQKDGRVVSSTRKTTAKAKKPTTRKAKKPTSEDLLDIPTFLKRWVGKEEVISYVRNDDGDLIKVTKKGDQYFAETDKKVPAKKKAKSA